MSILTFSARCAFLQYVLSCPLHVAVGTGSSDWGDVPPDPEYEATALVNEKGRINKGSKDADDELLQRAVRVFKSWVRIEDEATLSYCYIPYYYV